MDPKKKKTLLIVVSAVAAVALVLVILFATGVLGKASIVGSWEVLDLDGKPSGMIYTFYGDGTGLAQYRGEKKDFNYKLDGDLLTIIQTSTTLKITELSRDSMTVQSSSGTVVNKLKRIG